MKQQVKHRLVGFAVLVSLLVLFVPVLLQRPGGSPETIPAERIPPRPARVVPETKSSPAAMPAPVAVPAPGPIVEVPSAAAPGNAAAGTSASVSGKPEGAAGAPASSAKPGLAGWAVQLGSFGERANAQALRDRLKAKGFAAFLATVVVGQHPMTRVYVGPSLERADAEATLRKLQQAGQAGGLVVRYLGG